MATSEQTEVRPYENRYRLRNRYVFRGKLVMQTALHIGGGRLTLSSSDSPVVLTPDQKPFIPGSSFKGSLRSTVEKIVPSLPEAADLFSCGLVELDREALQEARSMDRRICSTARQWEIALERRNNPREAAKILEKAVDNLCNTCQLFGSPFAAARLSVSDLYMPEEEWQGIVQIRDGVAIDRDSETALDGRKYDFEVVPPSATFELEMVLENATEQDIQLLCVGLSEFVHGYGVIGGKRSRGLGVSRLDDLRVSALELSGKGADGKRRLRDYLISKQFSREVSGEEFLKEHIEKIFA